MKSIILKITLAALLSAGSQLCLAQCDKTISLKSSKTSYLSNKDEVERSQDQKANITITKTDITILVNDDQLMSGSIKIEKCEWPIAFKVGKTVLKATVSDRDNNEQHATIIITGVEGKPVTLTYEAEERPGIKIMVTADSFEEKKL